MKLTDYLAQYIVDLGVKHPFLVTGGAAAHIVDSLGKNKKLNYVCMQHEQAAAMAMDGYSRVTDNFAVGVATSGPGATNFITGTLCSYFDSIPSLFITGQVNIWETKGKQKIRQLGFQETDIIDIVKPITKFAVMVTEPNKIKYFLDKAVYIAKSGRPGPVWIDLPMNIQHAEIAPEKLEGFDHKKLEEKIQSLSFEIIHKTLEAIKKAKRPVVIAGGGIKLGRAKKEFFEFIEKINVPVVTTWSGIDVVHYNHPLLVGQYGVYGSRAANFAVQNSDLIISLGSRLDTRQTGGQPKTFAREAYKIVCDIDSGELNKNWVLADLPVETDVKDYLALLNQNILSQDLPSFQDWILRTQQWKQKYPSVLPEYYAQKDSVNSYVFIKSLSDRLKQGDVIVADQGGNLTWTIQSMQVKQDQMLFSAFGNSPMGYALPASIGAAFAKPNQDIYCIGGDGGFQMNIQELQTVKHYGLPIKMFILNNHSYGIIKQFQEVYFEGRYEAAVPDAGYSMPNFIKVAEAYGIKTETIRNHEELPQKLDKILQIKGPVLVDVILDPAQKLIPKLVAVKSEDGQRYVSKPIEDMVPLLPRDEFYGNMIVKPIDEAEKDKSTEIN